MMSLGSQLKRYANVAVFCRNHTNLLNQAVQISNSSPSQLIAFRAKAVWRAAETALHAHTPRPIYFLPIVKNDMSDYYIRYIANLEKVVLYPQDNDETREILKLSVPKALNEGLWPNAKGKPTVKTIYLISNCRRVDDRVKVAFYDLKKLVDDEYIDPSFRYSYSIIHEHSDLQRVY